MRVLHVVILLCVTSSVFAQHATNQYISAHVAVGNTQGTVSAAFGHDWLLGSRDRIVIGIGGRFTGYVGRNQYYITAPASLTSNATGPLVIFKPNITANIDTFLIAKPSVFAFNAMINLGYKFSEKLQAGFNIDAIGFSLGNARRGNYINGPFGQMTDAKVTSFNALLVSDNDYGTLNSELYMSYQLNQKWSIRTGAQFLFTEYTTNAAVQQFPEPNDRFRNKSLMFFVGASYKLK